jgi:hypothetical protein
MKRSYRLIVLIFCPPSFIIWILPLSNINIESELCQKIDSTVLIPFGPSKVRFSDFTTLELSRSK